MWKTAFNDKAFRKDLFISVALLSFVLTGFMFVLQYAEQRNGFVIEKGWLNRIFPPHDFSNWIFACTYGATVLGIICCFVKPATALLLIRTYFLLQLVRALILLILPLDPPEGIIPLQDPFLHATFYNGRPNLKDLFFSGHVATLVMFIPIVPYKIIKWIIATAAVIAGLLLVGQRVHYVVDVLAAPLFAVLAYKIAKRWSMPQPA